MIQVRFSTIPNIWGKIWGWVVADDYPSIRGISQRASYQRSFILGWIVILTISATFGWWIKSFDSPTTVSESYTVRDIRIDPETKPSDSVLTARTSIHNKWKPYPEHRGFLGFDIKIIPDKNMEITPPQTPLELPEVYSDAEGDTSVVLSFSPIESDDTGVYIPEIVGHGYKKFEDESEPINRDIAVIYKVDPDYPIVAEEAGKEGKVILLIHVDEEGNLSLFPEGVEGSSERPIQMLKFSVNGRKDSLEYVIATEEPKDWFFASNLVKVIPDWKFRPSIENGVPVPKFLFITYDFCLGINCTKIEFQQIGLKYSDS